jgi:polyisoprenoid-binding protein YceI
MRIFAAGALGAILAAAALAGAAEAGKAKDEAAATPVDLAAAKAGVYVSDVKHRHILFKYDHQGFSTSYVRWRDWTGELNWDPADPEKSSVTVTINADKVDSGVDIFDEHLRGEKFFDTANHPTIAFKSTKLKRKGPNAGVMTGDLTIKNVTKPVTLDVEINKAAYSAQQKMSKVGFSAKGVVKRTDWGLDVAVPFVSDEVTIIIESEFEMADAPQQQ